MPSQGALSEISNLVRDRRVVRRGVRLVQAQCLDSDAQPGPAGGSARRVDGCRPGRLEHPAGLDHAAVPGLHQPQHPGDFNYINSDISFTGPYVIQGNFAGIQVWDITDPKTPRLQKAFVCPGSQSDVSVYRKLLFVSGEALNGRTDCGTQGVSDTVSHDRLRGIRIFDITDIAHPRHITDVQTCRGSHTHTVVTSPTDTANVYIYVSGSAPVRSPNELAGC